MRNRQEVNFEKMSLETIAEITELTLAQVSEIQKSIN